MNHIITAEACWNKKLVCSIPLTCYIEYNRYDTLETAGRDPNLTTKSDMNMLTKLISVKRIVPCLVFPNFLLFSAEGKEVTGEGKNQPSILAKSCRARRRNKRESPCLMQSITSAGKRGGV